MTVRAGAGQVRGVLILALLLIGGAAQAQAIEADANLPPMASVLARSSDILTQMTTGSRIPDQRYTSGPSLGRQDQIGDESLLRGLVLDERFLYGAQVINFKKTKKKR